MIFAVAESSYFFDKVKQLAVAWELDMDSLASLAQQVTVGVLACGLWHYMAPLTDTLMTYRVKPKVAKLRRMGFNLEFRSESKTSFRISFLIK